jgi:hypothetical protein
MFSIADGTGMGDDRPVARLGSTQGSKQARVTKHVHRLIFLCVHAQAAVCRASRSGLDTRSFRAARKRLGLGACHGKLHIGLQLETPVEVLFRFCEVAELEPGRASDQQGPHSSAHGFYRTCLSPRSGSASTPVRTPAITSAWRLRPGRPRRIPRGSARPSCSLRSCCSSASMTRTPSRRPTRWPRSS